MFKIGIKRRNFRLKLDFGNSFYRFVSVASLVFCASISAAQSQSVNSVDTGGSKSAQTASDKSRPTKLLNGSARQQQSLNSSVKLIPAAIAPNVPRTAPAPGFYPAQFSRRLIFTPNAPVAFFPRVHSVPLRPIGPPLVSPLPRANVGSEPAPQRPVVAAVSPPAANYTMTPTNGIVSWAPGYDSEVLNINKNKMVRSAVHGTLSAVNFLPVSDSWSRKRDVAFTPQPVLSPLRSTPKLLTELLVPNNEKRASNWDEWNKRICRTVYNQWLLNDTGPGKVCIHITVWSSRDLECRVVEFSPVADIARDAQKESQFRQAALQAVNSLNRCALLDFPPQFARNKVGFDLDMDRAANGVAGFQVVAARALNP